MFSGIVQAVARVEKIRVEGGSLHFTLSCPFTSELHIDQSVAHNGVCLTVVDIDGDKYTVTAIAETLERSNLGLLKVGDEVNLERSMRVDGMLDGHIVQGHVDTTARCTALSEENGSWRYDFN
ncbi:MAG: riboflavin synthase, partial [Mucinivorans sp.]